MTGESRQSRNVRSQYPELGASDLNGVNVFLQPDITALDFGAGGGGQLFGQSSRHRSKLSKLKGKVKWLIGADLDLGSLKTLS